MKKLVQVLKALGNEKRLKILRILKKYKDISVRDLSRVSGINYKTLDDHLLILSRASLIHRSRDRRLVLSKLQPGIQKIIDSINNFERRNKK